MRLMLFVAALVVLAISPAFAVDPLPTWVDAHRVGPLSADETRAFMRRLSQFVFDHHLKKTAESEQRGMIYEYYDVTRKGQHDQFVQGEALDTMHDGAWFSAALIHAYRATGDEFYRELLTDWTLPFYLKMLNHSDELFHLKANHARPERQATWRESKEWLLQEGEKGFVPYWWDDGGSVSLEQRIDKKGPAFPCYDHYTATNMPNLECRLQGYSLGSSNHLAQDLGVMLQAAWLLLRSSPKDSDRKLVGQLVEAAKNLHQCRMNHHGYIPMCVAPAALATGDVELWKRLPDFSSDELPTPENHYVAALYSFKPGQRYASPGFADDQEYRYCYGIARHVGQLPKALAFRTLYDAYTEPMLYAWYCDDAPAPPGVNRFDLHPYYFRDGKPEDYRSDRKGPSGRPRPAGSRMGPQNMVVCGWALQALKRNPGIWEERYQRQFAKDSRVDTIMDLAATKECRLNFNEASLSMHGTRTELWIRGRSDRPELAIVIFSGPDGQGSHAIASLNRDGGSAKNDKGETLAADIQAASSGQGFNFKLELPYTAVKGQKAWANGIEHGRYSIRVGQETKNLYFASSLATVQAWLARELGTGLRTWEVVFKEKGYIPTSLGGGAFGGGYQLDNLSDSGGYAHLLSAAAQWLLYLDGRSDWEIQQVPQIVGQR